VFTRSFVGAVLGAAAVAVAGGTGTSDASTSAPAAFHSTLSAKLTGKFEIPKGSPKGTGTARITLDTKKGKACWSLSVHGLDKLLAAHIHVGKPGKNGPVIIPLGAKYGAKGCIAVPKKSLLAVGRAPYGFYVNVHTRKYINGAIRGQLHSA
jgi:CHRD domain-containing protein